MELEWELINGALTVQLYDNSKPNYKMKTLFTLLFTCITLIASAQCSSTCSPCTTPTIPANGVSIEGTSLWINWDNSWFWGNGCSKGVTFIIDGQEYFGQINQQTGIGMVIGNAGSGIKVPGYTVIAGASIIVKVRNYCSYEYPCDTTNYVESAPYSITAPSALPTATIAQKCKVKGEYKLYKDNQIATANKPNCVTLMSAGWYSPCNCK